jgi:serine/threonine-protein kinase
MSLPRPDPAALWLAQQEAAAKRPGKRNTGVLAAVVVLTTLCVLGIAALLYFKLKAPSATATTDAQPVTVPAPSASAVAVAPPPMATATVDPAPVPSASASAPPTASAVASAVPSAAPVAAPVKTSTPSPGPAPTAAPAATAAAAAGGNDPGFLTIVCNPFCDDVVDQGRSLGPSPVVRLAVKPGQHRITLKRSGFPTKTISVIVVSGQVTAQRVSMK